LGRITGNVGPTLFKKGLFVAQPTKTRQAIKATLRLIIAGIRHDSVPGAGFPITDLSISTTWRETSRLWRSRPVCQLVAYFAGESTWFSHFSFPRTAPANDTTSTILQFV
jgi:hypothetical protein